MGLVLADRVKDTTTTTGTGTVALANSAPSGYRTFGSVLSNGDTTYYCVAGGAEWEVGLGTYSTTGPTLARTAVLSSSNGGSPVNFSAGTKDVFLTAPAVRIVSSTGGGAWTPAQVSWAVALDPDSISGNDGDALASVPSGGTADAFTQATGAFQPVLRKGANGCNGHNAIQADGSNDVLATTTGGAALSGTWYVGVVVSDVVLPTGSNVQDIVSWGDNSAGKARQILIGGPTFWNTSPGYTNSGSVANSNSALTANTWYFLEFVYAAGALTVYKNGTAIGTTTIGATAYASTVIRLFTNPSGSGECLNGKIAGLWMYGGDPTQLVAPQLRTYVASRFALSVANGTTATPFPVFLTGGSVLGNSNCYQDAAGNLIFGGAVTQVTQGTNVTPNNSAILSAIGPIAAIAQSAEHLIQNKWSGQNVLAVQSLDRTGGLSAIRFPNYAGVERSACGVGNPAVDSSLDAYPFYQSDLGYFIETSQDGSLAASCLRIRLIQTGTLNSVTGYHRRLECDPSGNVIIYKVDAAFPNETAALTVTANGTVKVGTTIATNATAGHFKVPTCAGTPTGVPEGGAGSLTFDTVAKKLWIYDGSAWVQAALS